MNEPKIVMLEIFKKVLQKTTGRKFDDENTNESEFLTTLNSIEFVSVVVELETVLNMEFDETKLVAAAFPTLDDFIEYLIERANSND